MLADSVRTIEPHIIDDVNARLIQLTTPGKMYNISISDNVQFVKSVHIVTVVSDLNLCIQLQSSHNIINLITSDSYKINNSRLANYSALSKFDFFTVKFIATDHCQ